MRFRLSEIEGKDVCHFNTGSDEAERLVLPTGTFAYSVDVSLRGC